MAHPGPAAAHVGLVLGPEVDEAVKGLVRGADGYALFLCGILLPDIHESLLHGPGIVSAGGFLQFTGG